MNIISLPDGESFYVGIDVPMDFTLNETMKPGCFCILFLSKGHMSVEINFVRYDVDKNTLLIFGKNSFIEVVERSPDLLGSYIVFSDGIWLETTSRFDPAFFGFIRKHPKSPKLSQEQVKKHSHMLNAMLNIYNERGNSFRLNKFINSLQNLLWDIYDTTSIFFKNDKADNTPRQEELMKRFMSLVFEFGSCNREVKFYADKLCITTRYLSSIVQKMTGHTPKEMIGIHCIHEIKTLLKSTNDSIQEIAFRLHFPDQSFLARYFKKHTGMSPIEYRRKREK